MAGEITRLADHKPGRRSIPSPLADAHNQPSPERAAAAEEVAAAAHHLISTWAAWGLLQAAAIASERPIDERQLTLWESGAGDVMTADPVSASLAYTALERLDEAMDRWLKRAHEEGARI